LAQQDTDKLHEQERELYSTEKRKMALQIKSLEDEIAAKNKKIGELEVLYF
jgi:hypothetical protein